MNKKNIFGAVMVAITALSLIPFISNAQPKQQANGIIIGGEEVEVHQPRKVAIAECGFKRPIRVASFVSNPPFGWVETYQGSMEIQYVSHGFGMDIFDKIAKNLGIRYTSTGYVSYQKAVNALKRGELDLLIGVYTPGGIGRGTQPVYPSFFKNLFAIYYPNDRSFPAYSFESLEGKKGIIRREENIYPLFSSHVRDGLNISLVNTAKKAFEMLMNGEADYLIGSPYSVEAELRRYKLHEDIVPADWIVLEANMFFVLTTNTDCFKLRNLLSKEIEQYISDPKNVNKDITDIINAWGERFREDAPLIDTQGDEEN